MGRLRPRFAAAPPPRSRGARELTDEIDRWNARAFAILTISTALVGFYNLVWTNSFGTTRDLVACVLWGLGLPLGSKAVTTLASVATTLGLNLSRA